MKRVCGEGRFSPEIVCLSVFLAKELSEGRVGKNKKKKKRNNKVLKNLLGDLSDMLRHS